MVRREIEKIQKRDGTIVDFDQEKITQAILKALTATNSGGRKLAKKLSDKVVFLLKKRFKEGEIPKVEEIQDIVEEVLILEGLVEAAKAYILYREQRRRIREALTSLDEAVELVDEYINEKDWEVKENANMAYSLQGLNHYVTSAVTKKYWLEKIYPKEIREAAKNGDFHIHNLDTLATYCCGWDLYDLLVRGFGGVKGKVECRPPKHLRSALGQAVNFLYTLQGECYSEDTEVLTESGWKRFYEVTPNDRVFTLNPSTNEIELQKPIRFYEFDWNGELYHFHSKKLDLLVTPNHRMLVDQYSPYSKEKYRRKFVEARNFKPSEHFIPKSGGIWKGRKEKVHYLALIETQPKELALVSSKKTLPIDSENFLLPQIEISQYRNFGKKYERIKIEAKKIPLKDWLAFFGFWLAEGSLSQRKRIRKGRTKPYYEYAVRITQNIGKTASEFEAVLKRLPFSYLKNQKGKKLEFVIYNKQLFSYLKQFGKAEEKFIPQEIKELDKEYLEILFEWMMKGDGYQGNGNIQYCTKSKRLADDLQEIILKLGYSANIYRKEKAGKFSWYVVSVSKRKHFKLRKENIKKVFYQGKVYCLEVPNHTLYVRRNGKACWCGNSAGAQAFNSFDTLLAPFIRYDNLTYQQVKQCLQEFIYNCAVPTRVGFQSLCWDEIVVVRNKGKIRFIEIGKLIDEYFGRYPHQVIEQHPQSYAIPNFEDWEVLSFNKEGKAIWKKVKAFIRHKVPKNSEFVEIRTNRGTAKVSVAHSLFAFKKLNGKFNPIPKSALEVEKATPNYQIKENNHFLALSSKEREKERNYLDLLEILEDFSESFLRNVFVKINPSKTISKIKGEILKEYQSFLPFWKEFGFKDRGIWKQWLKNKSVRFDVWKKFFKPKPKEVYLQLRNSKRWYPRIIKGKLLEDFVKLCAYYISEGHSQISTCLFISQAEGENFKEIVKILKNLNSLGKIYLQKGFSQKGNKTKKVYKITGDGLLAEIVARSCGYLSFNKVIPWFIFNLKQKYQKLFIKTLLKGDGAEFDNYWEISTTSKKLASSLSLLLAQNGFRFSVYFEKVSKKNKNWRDQYVIRIFKNKNSRRVYKVNDFEARICLGVEKFKYKGEYEYDISVDLEEENFIGGPGLLVFHNTPFTNVTLDLKVPPHLKNEPVIIGGKPQKETYGDFQEEMDIFNKAFYEVMCEGDAKGRVFSVDGDSLCPVINSQKVKLVKIGEFIDEWMKKEAPFYIKENNCEVLDVRKWNLKCLGMKDGKLKWEKINFLVRHPVDFLLKISTVGGFSIKVTPSHSVLVLKEGEIKHFPAGSLRKGDYLVAPKLIPQPPKSFKAKISLAEEFLKKGKAEGIYISEGKKTLPLKSLTSKIKKFNFSKAKLNLAGSKIKISNNLSLDKNLMEFLGWYCAEGSAEKSEKYGGISLGFNLKKEKRIAIYVANLIRKIWPEVPISLRKVQTRNLIEIRVHSKLVRRIITEIFEIGNKEKKKVPSIVFEVPCQLKKAFLKGYFKGDAWISKKGIFATSISKELIYGISTLLKQLNIFHTLTEYQVQGRERWRINIFNNNLNLFSKDSHTISKIPIKESGLEKVVEEILKREPYFYDALKRKYKNSKERILRKFGIDPKNESTSWEKVTKLLSYAQKLNIDLPPALKEIKKNNLLFLKIKEIKKTSPSNGMVYDFSTESENFVANQILVHNTFPIPTINITQDFDWDNPAYEGIWLASAKYGLNYFANFVNSDMKPEDARSMCCRLRLDNRELYKRGGGLFGSWPKTGSIGVVTINLPRIGYLSKTKKEFFQRLKDIMDLAKESLDIKRKALEDFMEKGLYPYSKHYLSDVKKMRGAYFGNHFSTIGIVGMNEALLNFLGEDIGTKRGLKFAIEVLDFMRERLVKYQQENGCLYNLEATPAESTSYRLAKIDKEKYPDIITAGTKVPYYTNSTQLPVDKYTDDLFEALRLQDPLQTRYTGGTVFHIFLGERIQDHWMVPRLIKKIFERFKLPYITFTPTFSICPVHGYIPGEHFFCPKCTVKTPCEVYSRIVGYLRPVQFWNEGKQEEFRQRKTFKLPI